MTQIMIPTEKATCTLCETSDFSVPIASGWDFEYQTTKEEFLIMQCKKCKIIYLANRPQAEAMYIIYPEDYYSFDESAQQKEVIRKIRNKLELKKIDTFLKLLGVEKKSIMDIGCGDGRLLDIFKSKCPSWDFRGIEIGNRAVEKAKNKGYHIISGDFEDKDISFWFGTIDLILIHQMLEHTRFPRKVIQKIYSLLKKDGILSIETPDTKSWDWNLFRKRYWGGYHIPRHFYLFNKTNLTTLLEQEGFEIVACRSILSPVFWIHSLHNYFTEHNPGRIPPAFFHYQNPFLLSIASSIDLIQTLFFAQSSNMQVIARKK